MGWQRFESAPKDGTTIQVWRMIMGQMGPVHNIRFSDGQWRFADTGGVIGPRIRHIALARWMPLPPAPEDEKLVGRDG